MKKANFFRMLVEANYQYSRENSLAARAERRAK